MTFVGVPWAIGNGAKVGVEEARLLAYVAARAAEGVVGPGALVVQQTAVAGGSVRVMPGAAVLLNRFAGGGQQAYMVRNPDEHEVAISANPGSTARTDLVCVVVEDPQYAGNPAPASVENGPYVRVRVFENAGTARTAQAAGGAAITGIALAAVTVPAATSAITQAMIEDLTVLPSGRVGGDTRQTALASDAAVQTLTSTAGVTFPAAATWNVPVPAWAVKATLEVSLLNMQVSDDGTEGGNWRGTVEGVLGTVSTPGGPIDLSSPGANKRDRFMAAAIGDLTIPKAMRGTTQTLRVRGKLGAASGGMTVEAVAGTMAIARVTYYELADSTHWTT